MHARFSTLTLLALAAVHAVSGQTQKCAYSCPATDSGGFALGTHSDTDGNLSCSYPAFPDKGDEVNGFSCQYSDTTGQPAAENDTTFCPATAASSCGTAPVPTTKPAPPTKTPPATKSAPPSAARDLNEKMMKKRLVAEDQA